MEDQGTLARKHFDGFCVFHDGPLVISYRIDDTDYMVIASPGPASGRRLMTVVPYKDADDKVFEYVESVGRMFGYNNMLIKDMEVFEGKVV